MKAAVVLILLLAAATAFEDGRDLQSLTVKALFMGAATVTGDPIKIELTSYAVPSTDSRSTSLCDVQTFSDGNGSYLKFFWQQPPLNYAYTCEVVVDPSKPRVTGPVSFPFTVPQDVAPYLEESFYVHITPEVSALANQITYGLTDGFEIAARLGEWVFHNIKYSKEAIPITEGSDYALSKRAGACDEISHLYIALLRARGIPARYVAGSAWGGSAAQAAFGNHGWVEAWLPPYGWVPFDATFGQFGYVDATHIKYYSYLDGSLLTFRTTYSRSDPSTSINWRNDDGIYTVVAEKSGRSDFEIDLQGPKTVKLGGYALVEATVKNVGKTALLPDLEVHYLASNIPKEQNLELVLQPSRGPVLYPGETAKAYWVFRASAANLVFPVVVYADNVKDDVQIGVESSTQTSSLSVTMDKDAYALGETATLYVQGTNEVTVLPAGVKGFGTIKVPVSGEIGVYSDGDFVLLKPKIVANALNIGVNVPAQVISGQEFVVSVSAPDEATFYLDSETKSGKSATFTTTMTESGELKVRAVTQGGTVTVSRFVTVVPEPEVEVNLPNVVVDEPVTPVTVSNGELVSYKLQTIECGSSMVTVNVTYRDALGDNHEKEFAADAYKECNPIMLLIYKLLSLVGWKP